jgi:molybdate transport system permease protein
LERASSVSDGAAWSEALIFSPAEWTAIFLSLKVATVGALESLPFAVGLARLLLIGFGRHAIFGRALEACCSLTFSFRWTGAALAAAVMGFRPMARATRLSIEAVDARLEQAA